jgi:DNA repair protein RAD5
MERKIYDNIYQDAKNAYDRFNARGAVGKNMSNILAMLMRLRRAVLHPSLIQPKRTSNDDSDDDIMEIDPLDPGGKLDLNAMIAQFTGVQDTPDGAKKEENSFAADVLKNVKEIDKQECPLCLDTMDDPVLIPDCHHAG